jgi:hypothetical protein
VRRFQQTAPMYFFAFTFSIENALIMKMTIKSLAIAVEKGYKAINGSLGGLRVRRRRSKRQSERIIFPGKLFLKPKLLHKSIMEVESPRIL